MNDVKGTTAVPAINMRSAGAGSRPIMIVRFGVPEIDGAAAISVSAVTRVADRPVKGRT